MADKHTITVQQTADDRYEAVVTGIGASVTGTTLDEVLTEAERAIVTHMIEESRRKKQKSSKKRTVA
jgi:hypothetical protein